MRLHVLLILLTTFVAGCPGELPPPGDDPPVAPPDMTEVLGPDETRAGILTGSQGAAHIGGVAGEARAGDYLLYNDRARFVLQGLREGHGYMRNPGSLIDADIVRPEGQADHDGVDDLITMPGLGRLYDARTFEVVSDGTDGGAAVIRTTGVDVGFTFLNGVIEAPDFFDSQDLEIVQTYTLEPGVPALRLDTEISNTGDDSVTADMLDGGLFDLGTHTLFAPGAGFGGDTPDGGLSMIVAMSYRNDNAVGIFVPEGNMEHAPASTLADAVDLLMAQGTSLDIDPGATVTYTRYIGVARDVSTLEEYRREIQTLATGAVEGVVRDDTGDGVAGARVFLTDGDGVPWTLAVTDDDGAYRLVGPAGAGAVVATADGLNEWVDLPAAAGQYGAYAHDDANERSLHAFYDPDGAVVSPLADGYGRSEVVDVSLSDGSTAQANLVVQRPAMLNLRVEDDAGEAMPSVVHIHYAAGTSDPQPPDGRLGEDRGASGARRTVWLVDGEATVPIAPGTYDLVAHRGFRHETDTLTEVEAVSGETTEALLILEQAYTTDGWISADLHVHASPSPDGECTIEERLATVVAADVDVHISTDHDAVGDYRDAAAAMGLEPWMVTIPGDEFSPVMRGHFNLFPIDPDPTLPNNGAPLWWEVQLTTTDLVEFMRTAPGNPMVQVNHGYGPGMFTYASYDEETGEVGNEEFYADTFDTMEILNGSNLTDAERLRDVLCHHLDTGLRPVGTGTSDAHSRWRGPGRSRTYVRQDVDAIADLDQNSFFGSLAGGAAVVSAGPFVIVEAVGDDGMVAEIGESLDSDTITLQIQVLGPTWMGMDEVVIRSTGCQVLHTEALQGEAPYYDPISVELDPYGDTYFIVEVTGSSDMSPVWPGMRAYAMTNPIFNSGGN